MATTPTKEIKTVSSKGLSFIAKEEGGYYLKPYLDIVNVPTISAGCTFWENGTKVKMTDRPITLTRAKLLFQNLLQVYELGVYSRTRDDISQNQFDALVSFTYNVGVSAFASSSLLKKVNANPNDQSIKAEFAKWKYAAGKIVKGLELRRGRESALYFS